MKLLLSILLSLIVIIKSQDLDRDQLIASQKIILDVYGVETDDPCNFYGFSCTSLDSDSPQTIVSIQLQSKQAYQGGGNSNKKAIISNDFTIFKDLQYFELFDIEVTSDFFYSLESFRKLNILRIDTHSSPILKNFKLPVSLTLISIKYMGGKIVSGFFNGGLNILEVRNSLNGFDITDGSDILDNNSKFSALTLPIVSNNTQSFMNSIGIKFRNLNKLTLTVDESTSKVKRDIQIPSFKPKSFKSLTSLNIYFQPGSLEKPMFPYSINNLLGLSQLILNSNQYIMDPFKPYIDLTGINKGLIFRSTLKCDYLSSCKIKPCIKLPRSSTVNVLDCGNFDYSNIQIIK